MDALNKLAVIISGPKDAESGDVNGVYLYHGMKDEMPSFSNLTNRSYLHCTSNGIWHVSTKIDLDTNKSEDWCLSVESGWGHPSRCQGWKVLVSGKMEELPAFKVAAMVSDVISQYLSFLLSSPASNMKRRRGYALKRRLKSTRTPMYQNKVVACMLLTFNPPAVSRRVQPAYLCIGVLG